MPDFSYFLSVCIGLSVLYFIYKYFFAKMGFYRLNRYVLLFGLLGVLALNALPEQWKVSIPVEFIPVIEEQPRPNQTPLEAHFGELGQQEGSQPLVAPAVNESGFWSWAAVLSIAYYAGVFLLTIQSIVKFRQSWRLMRNSKKGSCLGYKVNYAEVAQPCILFNHILCPRSWIGREDDSMRPIMLHELAHQRQAHWIDIFIMELLTPILWFFPLFYLLKKEIRLNLEFLADREALKVTSTHIYQEILWKYAVMGNAAPLPEHIQSFYTSPLKLRIMMMKSQKTSHWKKGLYLLIIPALMWPALSFTSSNEAEEEGTVHKPKLTDITPVDASFFIPGYDKKDYHPDFQPIKDKDLIRLSSGFGMRIHPVTKKSTHHRGVDFSATEGTPIYAAATGIISEVHKDTDKYGYHIVMTHGNTAYTTLYAHMKGFAVEKGQVVKKGQIIGYVGNTGQSFAPHLHFEIREGKKAVNPIKMLNAKC